MSMAWFGSDNHTLPHHLLEGLCCASQQRLAAHVRIGSFASSPHAHITNGLGSSFVRDPGHIASERSQVDRWMDWAQTALQPDFLMSVFWGFYRTPESHRNWPAIREKIARCSIHFQLLDTLLADRWFLCGDTLSLADIPAGTSLFRYFGLDIERPSPSTCTGVV